MEPTKPVGVDIKNRDGVFLRFIVRPLDTVESLIRELLESREVDRVCDLRLNNMSLLHGPGSSATSLLIRDCGVRAGSILRVVERPLVQCHVHLLNTERHRTLDVDLLDGEGVLELRKRVAAAFELKSPTELPLLYISGGICDRAGRKQRYNRVRMNDTQKEVLMNAHDQMDASRSVGLTHYCRTLLQDNDFLPSIENGAHVVKARADVQFWQMVSDPWMRFRRIEHGGPELFDSPVYCAWFSAYIVSNAAGEDRFLLHCFGDTYSDMVTGETVEDVTDSSARYAVIFVAPDVRFPKMQIKDEKRLFLWCREGARVWLNDGTLEAVSKRAPSGRTTWVAGRVIPDKLMEYFKTTEPADNIYDEADWCHRKFSFPS